MQELFNPSRHPSGNSWPPSLIALHLWLQQLLSSRGLLVKLQVYQLMSGSLRAIWDQTKMLSHKQEFSCLSYLRLCVIFLKVTHSARMQWSQPCEERKGMAGTGVWEALFRLCVGIFWTKLSFVPLGRVGHWPNLNIGVHRGLGLDPMEANVSLHCYQGTHCLTFYLSNLWISYLDVYNCFNIWFHFTIMASRWSIEHVKLKGGIVLLLS